MTDRCPLCKKWYLILDRGGARCTNQKCEFTEEVTREEYIRKYADRSRMVVFPPELGGGFNPIFR